MRRAPIALLLSLLGCVHVHGQASVPAGTEVPAGAYRFEPYPFYRMWHAEVRACAHVDGDFDAIEWWAVPSRAFVIYNSGPYVGYFDSRPEPDRIYVVDWDLENEGLIKHEMLHQRADTIGEHPSPPYDLCAPRTHDGAVWRR